MDLGDDRLPPRFWTKVVELPTGCWEWQASLTYMGYGQIATKVNGVKRPIVAHRWAYEVEFGSVPAGFVLDHLCHGWVECSGGRACPHRRCVNPKHLEVVTRGENVKRGSRWLVKQRSCHRGHPYGENDENRWPNGKGCRLCHKERYRT